MTSMGQPYFVGCGGSLGLTREEGDTRRLEKRVAWGPARYFYAGRAHPDFGDVVLAYDARVEEGATGEAHPFDTGGLIGGHCPPGFGAADGDAARAFLTQHRRDLAGWREAFHEYLDAHFHPDLDYLFHPPRDLPESWPGHTAPAEDWRSWTWEVRLWPAPTVARGLIALALSPTSDEALAKLLRDDEMPDWAATLFEDVRRLVDVDPAKALEQGLPW